MAAREVSHAAFELCEFIEDIADKPTDSQEVARFKAGQRYAAKSIRKGLGIWLTDEENRRTDAAPLLGTRPEADAATQPLRQPLTEAEEVRQQLAHAIKASIKELANGVNYPDLMDAVDQLAALTTLPPGEPKP